MRVTAEADSLVQLAQSVRTGACSPVDLLGRCLTRVEEVEPHVSAFSAVAAERAQQEAARLAVEAARGHWRGPLHGVPVAVKDLFDVAGEVTTAGSRTPPADLPADVDAEAVRRLRAAGAVVVGRTRTHEYAWGLTTQHEVLGGTRNPYDTARVPGGSSGGSAAAVAAGVVPLALGTDTAGSIRLPAAWCGLVGHKPTHGQVSLSGVVPLAPSLDHAGALVRDVPDARLALSVLTGRPVEQARHDLQGVRVGRSVDATLPDCSRAVAQVLEQACSAASFAGGRVQEASVPEWQRMRQVFVAVQGGEAAAYHRGLGHWPRRAALYDGGVRGRLAAADALSPTDIARAREQRTALRQEAGALLDQVDVLLQPVAGTGPSLVDDPDTVMVDGRREDLRAQVLPYTLLASLCGLPACSIPAGVDEDGLPVGVQVIAAPSRDALVLDVAHVLHGLLSASPSGW